MGSVSLAFESGNFVTHLYPITCVGSSAGFAYWHQCSSILFTEIVITGALRQQVLGIKSTAGCCCVLALAEHLLRARRHSPCSSCGANSLSQQPDQAGTLLIPILRNKETGAEEVSNLPRVIALASGRGKIFEPRFKFKPAECTAWAVKPSAVLPQKLFANVALPPSCSWWGSGPFFQEAFLDFHGWVGTNTESLLSAPPVS